MQIVRFRAGGTTRYGALERSGVVEYSGTPSSVHVEIRIDGGGLLKNPVVKL